MNHPRSAVVRSSSLPSSRAFGIFKAGLARWSERDWAGAIQQFEKSAPLERDQPGASPEITHNPSTMYLQLAREFQANPEAVKDYILP